MLEDLRDEIEKLISEKIQHLDEIQEVYDYEGEYSCVYEDSIGLKMRLKPLKLLKIKDHFQKNLELDDFYTELMQDKLVALQEVSNVFINYTPEDACNKKLLEERDIIPNIIQPSVYRDILNDIELDNRVDIIFVVSKDEEEDSDNTTYQLDLVIKVPSKNIEKIFKGGEAVDLHSASNSTDTLAKWLMSNLLK